MVDECLGGFLGMFTLCVGKLCTSSTSQLLKKSKLVFGEMIEAFVRMGLQLLQIYTQPKIFSPQNTGFYFTFSVLSQVKIHSHP